MNQPLLARKPDRIVGNAEGTGNSASGSGDEPADFRLAEAQASKAHKGSNQAEDIDCGPHLIVEDRDVCGTGVLCRLGRRGGRGVRRGGGCWCGCWLCHFRLFSLVADGLARIDDIRVVDAVDGGKILVGGAKACRDAGERIAGLDDIGSA